MPAPPSSKQKETNQKAMDAAKGKSNNFGGINTGSVKTNSKGSTTSFGPSTNSGTGFFGGINTNKVTNNSRGSINSFGPSTNSGGGLLGGPRQGISTPNASGSPLNNPVTTRGLNEAMRRFFSEPEDLTRAAYDRANPNAYMAEQYGQYRSPPNTVNQMAPQQFSPEQQRARIDAITRGPGLSDQTGYQKAITAVTAYPETPSGVLDPSFNKQLNTAALGRQGLFNLKGGTPEQNALVERIGPDALLASGRQGLDARTLMGQALTESTTGKNPTKVSGLAMDANNLFGIKGTGKPNEFWDGSTATMPTKEVLGGKTVTMNEPFRAYETPEQSVYDYARLMATPRYADARKGKTTVSDQLAAIRGAGYATHNPSDYVNMAMGNVNNLQVGGAPQTQTASITPTGGPHAAQVQAETGPSMWERYAPDMLQKAATSIDETLVQPTKDQIEKYGGFERAGKLAQMAVSVMNFLPGGTGATVTGNGGNPNDSTGFLPPQLAQNKNQTKKPPVNPVAIMPPQQTPWLYPQYSQSWAGLPTGIGGYMKG
jgi:flagellum-specific peptidoglycan hydrolase FlgJ